MSDAPTLVAALRRVTRLLCTLGLLAAGVLGVASIASAQANAPLIRIWPRDVVTSETSMTVTIDWCADQYGWNPTTQKVLLNYVDVTSDFTTTTYESYPGCVYQEKWTGTIPLQRGRNQISAQADGMNPNYSIPAPGYDVTTISTPVALRGVNVVSAAQFATVAQGKTLQQRFSIGNAGQDQDTLTVTTSCTGQVGNCTVSPSGPFVLASAGTADITVSYPASGTIGTEGMITLKATSRGDPNVIDSSWTQVTVGAAAPAAGGVVLVGAGDVTARGLCLNAAAGNDGAYECGDLRLAHALPTVTTLGRTRSPTLLYNSQHAAPYALLSADVTLPATGTLPQYVRVTVGVDGGAAMGRDYPGSDWGAMGQTRRVTFGFDASYLGTGIHTFKFYVSLVNGTTATSFQNFTNQQFAIVNRGASPFGAGWWLAGLEQLMFPASGDLFWVGGDGSTRLYRKAANTTPTVWRATNVDRPDSIYADSGGYVRSLANGVVVRFNGGGQHVATVNRLKQRTEFSYSAVNNIAVLDTVRVPTPTGFLRYVFHYNARGQLTSVDGPGAGGAKRVTTIVADSATGRIASITDPDTSTVSFGYTAASPRRVTSRANRRGFVTTYAYDAGGRLSGYSLPASDTSAIAVSFRAAETEALAGTAAPNAQPLDSVYTRIDGPRVDVADVAKMWLNRYGGPYRVRDPLGHETQVKYDATWPALPIAVRAPSGVRTRAWYNPTRALLDSTLVERFLGGSDTTSAVSRYLWDAKWEAATSITDPMGVKTLSAYDPTTGNRLWQQVGPDSARRVRFAYFATGWKSGMFAATLAPLSGADSIDYDPVLGNPVRSRSPKGYVSQSYLDAFGRDTLSTSPIDTLQQKLTRVRTTYDIVDQVRQTISAGPAIGSSPADSVTVITGYDKEGNRTSVTRNFQPTGAAYGSSLYTSWVYDYANRMTTTHTPEGADEFLTLDRGGNVVQHVMNSHTTTAEYDVLGRVTKRVATQVTMQRQPCIWAGSMGIQCYYSMPSHTTTDVCIDADTSLFAYDAGGKMTRADNLSARVRRTYTPSGLLVSDVISIAKVTSAGGTPCHPLSNPPQLYTSWPATGPGPGGVDQPPNQQSMPLPGGGVDLETAGAKTGPGGIGEATTQTATGGVPAPNPSRVGYDVDFTHTFTLRYQHDLDGRRKSMQHPAELAPCGSSCPLQTYGYDPQTGALTSVGDVLGYTHLVTYDSAMRVKSTTWGGGIAYDIDGNPVTRAGAQLTYDAAGRVTQANVGWIVNITRDGLGSVTATENLNTYAAHESFTSDAIGNRLQSVVPSAGMFDNGARVHSINAAGQLTATNSAYGQTGYVVKDEIGYWGSNLFSASHYRSDVNAQTKSFVEERSYYGADEKLRIFDRSAGLFGTSSPDGAPGNRSVYEEYRYDALGRRVWVHSLRDKSCPLNVLPAYPDAGTECKSYVQRTVWDGDQVLYEIRAEGADTGQYSSVRMEDDYIRVGYTHVMGIDAPALVFRWGHDGAVTAIVPHTDWRGEYVGGQMADGRTLPCDGCVSIHWPGRATTTDGLQLLPEANGPTEWFGTLIEGQTDGSGQKYMRNRYYDPKSGRFTQADPIGLAGGLNLYGYGNADPISYDDPLGLCWWDGCLAEAALAGAAAGMISRAVYNHRNGNKWYDGLGQSAVIGAAAGVAIVYTAGAAAGLVAGAAPAAAGIGSAAASRGIDPNKLNHIFGDPEHNLQGVVAEFGGVTQAFAAIQQAATRFVMANNITGVFKDIVVRVGSQDVTVRGAVVNGVVKIGTAFIPDQQ